LRYYGLLGVKMAIIKGERTLKELRKAHKTKASFNKAMRMDARERKKKVSSNWQCENCGENRVLDVCHIKAIADFDELARIEEINGPDNIKILCPTCHRLLDKKI